MSTAMIRPLWAHSECTRTTEAKGRNRWFVLNHADIVMGEAYTWLELCSKRLGHEAPIILRFANSTDMRTLGSALLAAAEHWDTKRTPDTQEAP